MAFFIGVKFMNLQDLPIYQPVEGWVVEYPKFLELTDLCEANRWLWNESDPAEDKTDLLTKLSKGELHAITTILQIFTLFELNVGDYWIDRIYKRFNRPEIKALASSINQVEINIHARAYQRINETLLGSNLESFYIEYKEIEQLKTRIDYLTKCLKSENDLEAFAAFLFTEGSSLFSMFGTIAHFQAPEYNKNVLKNITGTITLSAIDEDFHAIANALLFNTIIEELGYLPKDLENSIYKMAEEILELERNILDLVFKEGIEGLDKKDMLEFIKYRINLCLERINLKPLFITDNMVVATWFDLQKGVNTIRLHDFFYSGSGTYSNDVNRGKIRGALETW